MEPFGLAHYRQAVHDRTGCLADRQGHRAGQQRPRRLRHQHIILPTLDVVERVCAEAITRANRRIYDSLAEPLSDAHIAASTICSNAATTARRLGWPGCASPRQAELAAHARTHRTPQSLAGARPAFRHRAAYSPEPAAQDRPRGWPDDARRPGQVRASAALRHARALAIEGMATVTDEIIDLHDRILGKLFNAAKNKHQQQFQASGKAINAKVRLFGRIGQALIEAAEWRRSVRRH
jgi:hypothetical protein